MWNTFIFQIGSRWMARGIHAETGDVQTMSCATREDAERECFVIKHPGV